MRGQKGQLKYFLLLCTRTLWAIQLWEFKKEMLHWVQVIQDWLSVCSWSSLDSSVLNFLLHPFEVQKNVKRNRSLWVCNTCKVYKMTEKKCPQYSHNTMASSILNTLPNLRVYSNKLIFFFLRFTLFGSATFFNFSYFFPSSFFLCFKFFILFSFRFF
jgi:hypothetical protein